MIFVWIISLIRKVVWLFRLPAPQSLAFIDPNQRCPVCGGKGNKLRCVVQQIGPAINVRGVRQPDSVKLYCQHSCATCGARWHDRPVSKDASPSTVLPSIARTEDEAKEDRQSLILAEETANR